MYSTIEIQPPNELTFKNGYISVFLAGSITSGNDDGNMAIEWQKKFISRLENLPYIFFNPRRDDWDSSLEQEITNTMFKEQVKWELEALELADIIVMYFDKNTKAPISLLELGLHAREDKLIVVCPEGFWRKGNVDIVCEEYNITQISSFEELIEIFRKGNLKELVGNKI